jgi:hypothetical protein
MTEILVLIGLVVGLPVLFGVALGYAGLVREKGQFSLRALLIITTVVAMCLGAIVYAVKRLP